MPFVLMRPSSRPLVDAARAGQGSPARADGAAAELRADYERWGRWWCGLGAFVGTSVGVFLGGAAMDMIVALAPDPVGLMLGVVLGVAGLGLVVVCGVVLFRLWRTGRALVRGAAWWLRLPYRAAGRTRRASGWLEARTVNFEPPVFARIATSALALLGGVMGVSMAFAPTGIWDMPALATAFVAAGLLSLACGCGQLGGVVRLVSGIGERDPLWARLRGDG
ncbi:hypothetical protein [Cellulosimicrobium sp. NPDC057862]|uniref:hypothetical protein n=1 Tax=Cellulosimicrobium sp. NPDC057862 TaxID=3346266 RepID=UPI003672B296